MSELMPQLQPRYAFDVRSEWPNSVSFLGENCLVYGVGRHLCLHHLDGASAAAAGSDSVDSLSQSMTFLMRQFRDRPDEPPRSIALGGAGNGTVGVGVGVSGGGAGVSVSVSVGATRLAASASSSGAVRLIGSKAAAASINAIEELSARQHAAQLSEMREKDSFLADRTNLISCFGLISCAPNALSMADSSATDSMDRGAKKQLALGEYSTANRMCSVSILDLRGVDLTCSSQVDVRDLRSHTLFLPWSQFTEKTNTRRKGGKKGKQRVRVDGEALNMRLTSVEQSAAAAAAAASAGSSSAAAASSVPTAALEIELTSRASSAAAILAHRSKDRSVEARKKARDARRELREERRAKRTAREIRRRLEQETGADRIVDEQSHSDSSDSSSSSFTSSSSDSDSDDPTMLDSDDEALMSEREEDRARRDEDFDYDANQPNEEEAESEYAIGVGDDDGPAASGQRRMVKSAAHSTADGALLTPRSASKAKSTMLTRKLTHRLAHTPLNHSLSVAYAQGLFQPPPAGLIAAGSGAPPTPPFTKPVLLEFSHDGRYVAIVCDGPRWPLLIWDWQYRTRMMGHPRWVKLPVHTVRWHPADHTQLCVIGPKVFLHYRLQSSVKKQQASVTSLVTLLSPDEEFRSFCFLPQYPDAMVVCKTNKIIVLNKGIAIQSLDISSILSAGIGLTLSTSAGDPIAHRIHSVAPTVKGFAVATRFETITDCDYPFDGIDATKASHLAPAQLLLYEFQHTRTVDLTPAVDMVTGRKKTSEEEKVRSTTLFDRAITQTAQANQALQAFRVKCVPLWRSHTGSAKQLPFSLHQMSPSPNLSQLSLVSSTREIYLVDLLDADLVDDGVTDPACLTFLTPIVRGLHRAPVSMMEVAQEQPIILTASREDKSIRVYNYVDRECEIVKIFEDEPPLCIGLHPFGVEVLVAFDRQVVQLRVLLGSAEFVFRGEVGLSQASLLRYSATGAYFAVVCGKVIHVYSCNTLKVIARFKGHSDLISSVSWNGDDSILTSVGTHGCIYTWSMKTGGRLHQHDYINNSMCYSDVVTLPNGNIIAVGVQQATLGFDLEGLLNPVPDAESEPYRFTQPSGIKVAAASKNAAPQQELVYLSDDARIKLQSDADENKASHKFVICWNNRAAVRGAADIANEELQGATQYIHYPDEQSTSLISPTRVRSPGLAVGVVSGPVVSIDSPSSVLDALTTAELPVLPYLPVATRYHTRAVAQAVRDMESEGMAAAAANRRPMTARKEKNSQHPTHTHATDAHSPLTHMRPKTAGHSRGTTLASFLHREQEKEECPMPPLLSAGLVQVGRLTFLMVGTPRGTIQVFLWPMSSPEPISETAIHSEPITCLRVCQKTQCVITTALDGSMFVSSIALVTNEALAQGGLTANTDGEQNATGGASPATHNQKASPPFVFPAHLFLAPSFYPPLFSLVASPRLLQDVYGEQRALLTAERDVHGPARKKYLRSKYGLRRLDSFGGGASDEYQYSLALRTPHQAALKELAAMKRQFEHFQVEWEYKVRRDAEALSKTLADAREKHEEEKAQLEQKEAALTARDVERERLTLERLAKKEREYDITVVHLENLYEKKLALEAARYGELLKKMADLEFRSTNDQLALQITTDDKIRAIDEQRESETATLQKKVDDFASHYGALKESSLAYMEQEDMAHDEEVQHMENQATKKEETLHHEITGYQEQVALFKAQFRQSQLKIERSAAAAHESEQARIASENAAKEVSKRNAALIKKIKSVEESETKAQQDLAAVERACTQLREEKRNLREQIAALLEQRAANDPKTIIAGFEAIVKEMDEEFFAQHQLNRTQSAQAKSHRSTIAALQAEVLTLKSAGDKRETLFMRLREDILGMKDIRRLREKYFQTFLADESTPEEVAAEAEVEREVARQTRKNHATIQHLEHKVEEHARKLMANNNSHVRDNIVLMNQVNELRHVNRDFKGEIIRLTGEVAHQRLMLASHGVGGAPAKPGNTVSDLLKHRKEQVASMLASPIDQPQPHQLQQEIKSLEQLLLQERFTSAALASQVAESDSALKSSASIALDAAGHYAELADRKDVMLGHAFARVAEQEEEIHQLKDAIRAKAKQTHQAAHTNRPQPPMQSPDRDRDRAAHETPTNYSYLPASATAMPAETAANAANYVDSVIARAAALRTQLAAQSSATSVSTDNHRLDLDDDDDHDDGAHHDDVSLPLSGSSSVASSRPLSAAFYMDPFARRGVIAPGLITASVGVPPRDRPQTARVRQAATAVNYNSAARPASAVGAKGGRAGRNERAWNATTASTRTGSARSTAPTSAAASNASTPAPTFAHSMRGGRPISAHTTSARTTATTPLSTQRSMVATWMDEPTTNATIRPNPPAGATATRP